MNKRKIGVYPGFGTSTHELLHLKIVELSEAEPLNYYNVLGYSSTRFVHRCYRLLLSWIKFIHFLFFPQRGSVKFRGFIISHSIIETYVATDPVGKFRVNSKKTFSLIRRSINFTCACFNMLKQADVVLILGGDEAYIEGSIIAQIALKNNIKHLFLKESNFNVSAFNFNPKTLFAGPNYLVQNAAFNAMNISQQEFEQFENRLRQIVAGTSVYAYVRKDISNLDKLSSEERNVFNNAIVLYLHDFIDSPGLYGIQSIFRDQWEWINKCVQITSANKVRLVIKFHPNVSESNMAALSQLKLKYANHSFVHFWEKKISLSFLKDAGVKGVLTINGTIIVEAAYLNIPCLSASDHPFIGFALTPYVNSITTFKKLLISMCKDGFISDSNKSINAVKAFIRNSKVYEEHLLIRNFPYDDASESIFNQLFPETNHQSFGVIERRQTFLHSVKMKNYIAERVHQDTDVLRAGLNKLVSK